MNKKLVLGAEAIAIAAIDEGISGVYAYPGTPSTEITEYIQANSKEIRSDWASNEKTAYEAALGMSYAGKRSLACMKHVGLNVAADPFINSAITGVNGGMAVVVADDPFMHSSQNEQDTRMYGKFAYLPLLEPANQQEAYDFTRYAFQLSEQTELPVIVRITTRLSHSRSTIQGKDPVEQNELQPKPDKNKWVLLPSIARKRFAGLIEQQNELVELSETSGLNKIIDGEGNKAVIAFGIAFNYVMEVNQNYNLDLPVLKISQYPLPEKMIKAFCSKYDQILIAEEGYPIYEELLRGFFNKPGKFSGKLDGTLPKTGELTPDLIAIGLGINEKAEYSTPDIVAIRPPKLCQGCGHKDLYEALKEVLKGYPNKHVFADIGCYTLGALPPYDAIDTTLDMGASITMAKGAADAGIFPAIAVIGDSTFTHSGITGLLDAINDKANVTIIISDNDTTAMTGGQQASGSGKLKDICIGIGVDKQHLRTFVPLKKNFDEAVQIIQEEIEYKGVSVIIACRECIQNAKRK